MNDPEDGGTVAAARALETRLDGILVDLVRVARADRGRESQWEEVADQLRSAAHNLRQIGVRMLPLVPPARRLGPPDADLSEEVLSHFLIRIPHPTAGVREMLVEVIRDAQGRFRVGQVNYVAPERGRYFDAALWKAIPIADIETRLNRPHFRAAVQAQVDSGQFREQGGQIDLTEPFARRERKAPLRLPAPKSPRDRGDAFYRALAAAYAQLAHEGRPPGQILAEVNGVPKTTVARWVREARRRGLLAPAGARGRIG